MLSQILSLFPSHTHLLTLVSDPDRLLAGEKVMQELAQRGFTIIQEDDPVLLRYRVEEARPFTTERPVLIITSGTLEDVPYDLYQPAHRVQLSLHHYFPLLAYPVLQTLSPDQIEKLETCRQPTQVLSRQKTIEYLLREVFEADLARLSQPHALLAWLNDYHHRSSQLPDVLRDRLVEGLKCCSNYREWDIDLLIRDAQAFQSFVQQEWQKSIDPFYLGMQDQVRLKERRARYYIPFSCDLHLQDLVPGLVRCGTIRPLKVENETCLPKWAQPGVTRVDGRLQRVATLLEIVNEQVRKIKDNIQTGWKAWKELAWDWAVLYSYLVQPDLAAQLEQKEVHQNLTRDIDPLFSAWLKKNYTALGAQRLPTPHHVHHIPHYLAYQGNIGKIVLLVLDGLSLKDWQVIHSVWKSRHIDWIVRTELIIAQIPTITSISRYALISGLRPADFAGDVDYSVSEGRAWQLFWSREGVAEDTCKLLPLSYDRQIDQLPELQDPRVNFWCLIDDTLDKLAHKATLGSVDQQVSLQLWLDLDQKQNSLPLETLIDTYLDRGYSIFIASDHGHVEAIGLGQPSEGLLAQTRGKRARIYPDRSTALRVQTVFTDTILWDNDGLLPDQMAAIMPMRREAFAPKGELVVTHGGISIDEVVVPFIQISKESK